MSKKGNWNKLNRWNKLVRKEHLALTILFSSTVFALVLLSMIIAGSIALTLIEMDVLTANKDEVLDVPYLLRFMILSSIIIGILIAIPTSKFPLMPINKLINCTNLLAAGNYKVRLTFGWPITNMKPFTEISKSFNKLAEELESTKLLRNDFINNFSHEFKTPIVSIAGFAKLLKKENLTEEQRLEYLDIIEEEAMRLSYMATNSLNLTKVENQTILTEVTNFNLSEQLRSSILLLEREWEKKGISFDLRFDEYNIDGSEELLKQVWINLLDNAIKFSTSGSTIIVDIADDEENLSIAITNSGPEIPADKQKKIFHKFYQVDESHASAGNGIGLAIVKLITELHEGEVSVVSENNLTTFTVRLPKEQFTEDV